VTHFANSGQFVLQKVYPDFECATVERSDVHTHWGDHLEGHNQSDNVSIITEFLLM
jgi:hypothetical protein